MRHHSLCLLVVIVCLFACTISSTAVLQRSDPQFHQRRASDEEIKRDKERAKAMNKERAERIKRDTDKLLELATQLKQYVDKTNENVMSVEVIQKADEVEKLAKSIREKMKADYRPAEELVRP